ncbi:MULTISPECIES: TIM barrel protein [Pseudomonas]|uniref:TIM barrel protein n=1 Tax=Pseudomonas TaxID=286 RepID=UPI00103E3705|nr:MULTISPECIES: TIM barrel protein [Pseudomonas]MBI6975434.1 TIM barrel protein [Pseudomonas lactis]MCX2901623.1 TIM barrel protein [Pseudomonas mandelii]
MKKMFKLGCAGLGIQASSVERPVSLVELPILEQFKLVKEAQVWDFIDRIPNNRQELDEYIKGSQLYDLPVLSGSGCYTLGLDEALIRENLDLTVEVGGKYHNFMVWAKHKDGHYVTNEEVVACYLDAYEYATKSGVIITFENHVDMWSEDYRRVLEVADMVEARGVPFNMAMDYSHCIFKIENEVEHAVSQMRGDNEAIAMLDPFNSDSYADQWLSRNLVHWAQMRPAAPNGPLNWWGFETGPWDAKGIDRPGRSIQYPFERPAKGEWHTDMWHAHKLACTKEVTRKVIDAYLQSDDTSLSLMTIDNINLNAYGLGWKYNMFADSCAYANFVRELYAERAAVHQARSAVSPTEFVAQYRAQ